MDTATTVINIKSAPTGMGSCDVYIGWPSKWGNPYIVGVDGTREEVIELYRSRLLASTRLLAELPELQGKVLGCWCKPLPCHGDVLIQLLEQQA